MELDSGSLQLNSSDSSVEIKIQKNIIWYNNHPANESELEKSCKRHVMNKISNGVQIQLHFSSLQITSDIEFSTTANSTQISSCSEENMPTLSVDESSYPSIRNNLSEDCNLKKPFTELSKIDYSAQLGLSDTSEEDPFAASDDENSDYILSSNSDSSIELPMSIKMIQFYQIPVVKRFPGTANARKSAVDYSLKVN